jgi:hypothetical protein
MTAKPSGELASISFEQAISYTENLFNREEISDRELQTEISSLLGSQNGARGFFVSYLTGDWSSADHPTDGIVAALVAAPDAVAELLVKNLVMSTAMVIAHRRGGNESQAHGSERVRDRTARLIKLANLDEVGRIATLVKTAAETGDGEYNSFLTKWGYDREQREAIANSLQNL